MTPLYLITGFLGSGKTTFLKNILDQGTFCRIYIISINKYWKLLKNKSTKIANSSPFELVVKKPTLTNKDNSFQSSSIFGDLVKMDNDISLFEKMIGGDKPKNNNSQNKSPAVNAVAGGDAVLLNNLVSIDNFIVSLYNRLKSSPNILFGEKVIKKEYQLDVSQVAIFTVLRYLDMSHDNTIGRITLIEFLNRGENLHGLPATIKDTVSKQILNIGKLTNGKIQFDTTTSLGKICNIALGTGAPRTTKWKAKSSFEADLRKAIPEIFPGIQTPVEMNVNSTAVQNKILNTFGCKKISVSLDQEGESVNISNLIRNNPKINNRVQVTSLLDPGHGMLKQVGFEANYRKFFGLNNTFNASISTYSLFSLEVTFKMGSYVYYTLRITHNKPTLPDQESIVIRHKIGAKGNEVDVTPVSKKEAANSTNNSKKSAKFYGDNAQVVLDTYLTRVGYASKNPKCYADASGDGMYIVFKAGMATAMENSSYLSRRKKIPIGKKYVPIMMFTDKSEKGKTFVDFYYWLRDNKQINNTGNLKINNSRKPTPAISTNSMITTRTGRTGNLISTKPPTNANYINNNARMLYRALWNKNQTAIKTLQNTNVYKRLKKLRFRPSNYKNISMNNRLRWLRNLGTVEPNKYLNEIQKLNIQLTNINFNANIPTLTNAQQFAIIVRNRGLNTARLTRRSIPPLKTAINLRNKNKNIVNLASRASVNNLEKFYNESRGNANLIYNKLLAYRENSANSPQPVQTNRRPNGAQRPMNNGGGNSRISGAQRPMNNGEEVSSAPPSLSNTNQRGGTKRALNTNNPRLKKFIENITSKNNIKINNNSSNDRKLAAVIRARAARQGMSLNRINPNVANSILARMSNMSNNKKILVSLNDISRLFPVRPRTNTD